MFKSNSPTLAEGATTVQLALFTQWSSSVAPVIAAERQPTGIGPDSHNATPPRVLTCSPARQATGVPLNASLSVRFSQAMAPGTINIRSFTLTCGASALPLPGKVTYDNETAEFCPTELFAPNAGYTATVTTASQSEAGLALRATHVWTFTTGDTVAATFPARAGRASEVARLARLDNYAAPTSGGTGQR